MTAATRRAATAFGRFWWAFLVGDAPELFAAMLALVGVAFWLHHDEAVVVVALPGVAAAALVASARRGVPSTPRPPAVPATRGSGEAGEPGAAAAEDVDHGRARPAAEPDRPPSDRPA